MTSKITENTEWTDPKDFGLPFVEIKSLPNLAVNAEESVDLNEKDEENRIQITKDTQVDKTQGFSNDLDSKESKLIVLEASNLGLNDPERDETVISGDLEQIEESFTQDPKQVRSGEIPVFDTDLNADQQESTSTKRIEPVQGEKEVMNPDSSMVSDQKTVTPKTKEPAKSKAWIWIAAVLALVLVAVIYYQIQEEFQSKNQKNLAQKPEEIQKTQEDANASTPPDSITSSSPITQTEPSSSDSISSKTELNVGANSATNKLTANENGIVKITTKLDKPRYFIVVGSLPSENLAIQQAEVYKDRAQVIYLISPYGNIPNHRLSVGYFDSLIDASNEVERIKNQYKEQLWILKY
jgi:hypothetical protein